MKKVTQILWYCPICDFVSTREVKECPSCAHNEAYSMINGAANSAEQANLMLSKDDIWPKK